MDGRQQYAPPGGSNDSPSRASRGAAGRNEARRNSRSHTRPPHPDNMVPMSPGENTRALANSSNLAPSTRLKHYASLLLAEKPVEAHREFQRKVRTGSLHTEAVRPGEGQDGDILDTMNAGPGSARANQANGSAHRGAGNASGASPFAPEEFGDRNNDGGAQRPGEAGQGAADEEDLDADAADPEYEAYRKAFKQGFMYRTVRGEIVKNKRRRGRAGYLATLKSVYR